MWLETERGVKAQGEKFHRYMTRYHFPEQEGRISELRSSQQSFRGCGFISHCCHHASKGKRQKPTTRLIIQQTVFNIASKHCMHSLHARGGGSESVPKTEQAFNQSTADRY